MATSLSAGLFSRAGIRYEVALDVLGALIAHYAELIGIERSRSVPDEATVRQAEAIQRHLRRVRSAPDPRDADAIEAAIAHYAPLARRPLPPGQRLPGARRPGRRQRFGAPGAIILGTEVGEGVIERYRHRTAALARTMFCACRGWGVGGGRTTMILMVG